MTTITNFQLSSYLRFGADLRACSRARLHDADRRIAATRDRVEQSMHDAAEPLRQLDATRLAVYEQSMVAIQELHRGGNTPMTGNKPAAGQGERFAGKAPVAPARPELGTATKGIAAIAVAVVVIAAAAYGAEQALNLKLALALPIAVSLAVLLAVLLSMGTCYRVEQCNASVVETYAVRADDFEKNAGEYVSHASWLTEASAAAHHAIGQVASKADAAIARLEPVLMDGTNAAVLLRSVLDMALLDSEGGLVGSIMAELAERKNAIDALGQQVATRPGLIAA